MYVEVKIGARYFSCTTAGNGVCRYCGEAILWAVRPDDGGFVPLEPDSVRHGVAELHFGHCAGRGRTHARGREEYSRPAPPTPVMGIEMTVATWKQLLFLIHPDRFHGTSNERLATDLTRWLIEQRSRLK